MGHKGSVLGIDSDKGSLALAEAKRYAHHHNSTTSFKHCSLSEIEIEQSFDVVTAFNCLCYIEHPELALIAIRKLLKPGGWLIAKDSDLGSDFFWPVNRDADIEKLFLNRLEQTTIIRRPEELDSIGYALERSMEKTGQLVAVAFNPELGKLELSAQSLDAVGTSFIQSWHDHLASGIPGVITYAPISKPVFVDQTMMISDSAIRTFLYSPQIFASFLSGYLQPRDFNEILKRPYGDLIAIKNGDWKRFCDAYHEAITTVSET